MPILIKISVVASVVAAALALALIVSYVNTEGYDATVILRWGITSGVISGIFGLIAWGAHCVVEDRRRMAQRISDLERFREETACRMWARSAIDSDDPWFRHVVGNDWPDTA